MRSARQYAKILAPWKAFPSPSLFLHESDAATAQAVLETVFLHHKPQTWQGLMEVQGRVIWARLYMRSLRIETGAPSTCPDAGFDRREKASTANQEK